jgi:hypothetical protein
MKSEYYTYIRADIESKIMEVADRELSYHPNPDISSTFARKINNAYFDCRRMLDAYENQNSQEEWVSAYLDYNSEE